MAGRFAGLDGGVRTLLMGAQKIIEPYKEAMAGGMGILAGGAAVVKHCCRIWGFLLPDNGRASVGRSHPDDVPYTLAADWSIKALPAGCIHRR